MSEDKEVTNGNDLSATDDKDIAKVYYKQVVQRPITVHNFYIHGGIDDDEPWFSKLLQTLHTAPPNELIVINLDTYGGSVYAASAIINATQRCKAKVKLEVIGKCFSAGTFIALGGVYDEICIDPCSAWLFHTLRSFEFGKLPDIKAGVEFTDKLAEKFFTYYDGIITDKELDQIRNGKEFWLLGEEVGKRLETKIKLEEKKEKLKEKKVEKLSAKKLSTK